MSASAVTLRGKNLYKDRKKKNFPRSLMCVLFSNCLCFRRLCVMCNQLEKLFALQISCRCVLAVCVFKSVHQFCTVQQSVKLKQTHQDFLDAAFPSFKHTTFLGFALPAWATQQSGRWRCSFETSLGYLRFVAFSWTRLPILTFDLQQPVWCQQPSSPLMLIAYTCLNKSSCHVISWLVKVQMIFFLLPSFSAVQTEIPGFTVMV